MLVILSGIVILVKLVQSLNARSPMLVILFPTATFVKLVQFSNA